jgi:cytochrome c
MLGIRFLVPMLILASTPAFAEGDAVKGKTVFNRCAGCHTTTSQNKIGPSLLGVAGRSAASVSGFKYSKALSVSGIVWTDDKLDSYLAAPSKAVPGTSMMVSVSNADDRSNLISYLKTLPTQ